MQYIAVYCAWCIQYTVILLYKLRTTIVLNNRTIYCSSLQIDNTIYCNTIIQQYNILQYFQRTIQYIAILEMDKTIYCNTFKRQYIVLLPIYCTSTCGTVFLKHWITEYWIPGSTWCWYTSTSSCSVRAFSMVEGVRQKSDPRVRWIYPC